MSDLLPLYVYLAGPLFDMKSLSCNVLFAQKLESLAQGRFKFILPQDIEQRDLNPLSIRNNDLLALLKSDLALFHYDGTEIDSGTVVEYMRARDGLDMPAVLFRSDIRAAGDQGEGRDPWNLMMSGFPRTEKVIVNAFADYAAARATASSLSERVDLLLTQSAKVCLAALEKVLKAPAAAYLQTESDYRALIERYILSAGANFDQLVSPDDRALLAARKFKLAQTFAGSAL